LGGPPLPASVKRGGGDLVCAGREKGENGRARANSVVNYFGKGRQGKKKGRLLADIERRGKAVVEEIRKPEVVAREEKGKKPLFTKGERKRRWSAKTSEMGARWRRKGKGRHPCREKKGRSPKDGDRRFERKSERGRASHRPPFSKEILLWGGKKGRERQLRGAEIFITRKDVGLVFEREKRKRPRPKTGNDSGGKKECVA